ncbi:MAG: flippase [Candidatus Magasanikbacteria bacterium]|nr:flippase [Candidatus Magasanikbacteria bacterium]
MSFPLIAKNTLIQIIGRGFSTLFGLIALAAITRYLGQEQFGWYTTVATFLQFFAVFADFGLTLIGSQMIAEPGADEDRLISNLFSFRLLLSSLFFGSAMIAIFFFPYPMTIKLGVLVLTGSFFAATLQNIFMGVFQKHLRMSIAALGDAGGRFIVLVGYFLCIFFQWGLLPILAVSVAANGAQFLFLFASAKKIVKIKWLAEWVIYKKIFAKSWPIAMSMGFNLIYLRADTIILSLVRSQTEVGLYGAAYRVIDVAASIPVMFMGIILPHLTSTWHIDRAKFNHYFRRAFDFMCLIGLPFVLGGIYLAKPAMAFLAGAEFVESGTYLQILLIALLAIFFGALSGHAIVALNKQRSMIWGYIITAGLTLIGYFIFIPRYGAIGAGWMTVFSEILILILTFTVVERHIRLWPSLAIFSKSLISSIAMLVAVYFIPLPHFIYSLFLAILTYCLVLFLLKGITKEMIAELIK